MNAITDDVLVLVLEAVALEVRKPCKGLVDFKEQFASLALVIRAPLVVSSVCRRFRAVASHTPELWTMVSDFMPLELCRLFLHRSRSRPLAVAVERLVAQPDPRADAFLYAVLEHRDRWKSLYVALPDGHVDDSRFAVSQDRLFPMLEKVIVVGEQARPDITALIYDQDLFLSYWTAPRLTMAVLLNTMPHGAIVDSLTDLHICLHGPCLDRPDLWSPLARCDLLTTIQISCDSHVRFFNQHSLGDLQGQLICLESVHTATINLERMYIEDASWIFRSLSCPNVTQLSLYIVQPEEELSMLMWADELLSPGAVGCAESLTQLSIKLVQHEADVLLDSLVVIEYLFNRSTFASLGRIELVNNGSIVQEGMAPLTHFPASLTLLDLSGYEQVSCDAVVELIERLCEAGSHATLCLSARALGGSDEQVYGVVDFVKGYCDQAIRDGRMAFEIQWLEVNDDDATVTNLLAL